MSSAEYRHHRSLPAVSLAQAYMTAKESVIACGFASEIDWQHYVSFEDVSESMFLREAAWVILSAGMKETVIRCKFPAMSLAFCNWAGARPIIAHRMKCRGKALAIFGNKRKIDSIIEVASEVYEQGFAEVRRQVWHQGIDYIMRLPFMGPATSYHLAKNLGLDVVKPDRHLLRVAKATGYPSPERMCREIADVVGDKMSVVDLVIWRYATINRDYLSLFAH